MPAPAGLNAGTASQLIPGVRRTRMGEAVTADDEGQTRTACTSADRAFEALPYVVWSGLRCSS